MVNVPAFPITSRVIRESSLRMLSSASPPLAASAWSQRSLSCSEVSIEDLYYSHQHTNLFRKVHEERHQLTDLRRRKRGVLRRVMSVRTPLFSGSIAAARELLLTRILRCRRYRIQSDFGIGSRALRRRTCCLCLLSSTVSMPSPRTRDMNQRVSSERCHKSSRPRTCCSARTSVVMMRSL